MAGASTVNSAAEVVFSVHPIRFTLRGGDARIVAASRILVEEKDNIRAIFGSHWPDREHDVELAMHEAHKQAFEEPLVRDWVCPRSVGRDEYNRVRPMTLFVALYIYTMMYRSSHWSNVCYS